MPCDLALVRLTLLVYLKKKIEIEKYKTQNKPISHTRIYLWIFVGMLQIYMIVPTWLCPDSIVPTRDCVQTWLSPHAIVAIHDCAHTWLYPGIFVPQHELWLDTTMPMDNYNNCVHKILRQLYWCKDKYVKVLLTKRSEMWLFNYCTAITSSIPSEIFRNFNFLM